VRQGLAFSRRFTPPQGQTLPHSFREKAGPCGVHLPSCGVYIFHIKKMNVENDNLIQEILSRIQFRFMDEFTPGSTNCKRDPQANLHGLDLANTQIIDDDNPLMTMDYLRNPRMSTITMAYIINRLVKNMSSDLVYLNIGIWCGWSFFAGIIGNNKKCIGVDNYSQNEKQNDKKIFEYQYEILKNNLSKFYEMDYLDYFKNIHKEKIGVYFYEGDHSYNNQLMALEIADPFLMKGAYILVDDTNDNEPYKATIDFVSKNKDKFEIVLDKKTPNNSHPTFWNGLLIIKKII